MNRSMRVLCPIGLLALISVSFGQQPVDDRVPQRVGPIYARDPYTFQTSTANGDPYQFNWYSGRWDYVPVPYDAPSSPAQAASPYRFDPQTGQWQYNPWQMTGTPVSAGVPGAPPTPAPQSPAEPSPTRINNAAPDDTDLWKQPIVQPPTEYVPRPGQFEGQIVSIKAVKLAGEPQPHLLLRLRNADNVRATVDVGQRLVLPDGHPDATLNSLIAAVGMTGAIDGCPVLFAKHLTIGSYKVTLDREPTTQPK
jgi:hypothetical protein